MIKFEELSTEKQQKIKNQVRQQIYLEEIADIEYDAWCNHETIHDWKERNMKNFLI